MGNMVTIGDIYVNLHSVGQAVDVIVATPEDMERYRDVPYLVISSALREGRKVYRAPTVSTR